MKLNSFSLKKHMLKKNINRKILMSDLKKRLFKYK